eukprot:TRINITY_DN3641_c0_g1_i1.p1 TRINITY_DN3641_c0_g1~~TRINITY_DN3641_c0_g1_i1.p1  ORF type:complete len:350 (+),score=54.42 TRINITY_DN3641_c0_g1_i1:139-1188(+)
MGILDVSKDSHVGVKLILIACMFTLNTLIQTVNKSIFYIHEFKFPVYLTAVHMISSVAFGFVFRKYVVKKTTHPSKAQLVSILKLSSAFCVSVACGNIALRYIHVSFAQMIGSATPLFTVFASALILRKKYNVWVYFSTIPMAIGASLCVNGEANFNMIGFVFLVLAAVTRAVKTILGELLLGNQTQKIDSFSLMFYMAGFSSIFLSIYVILFENEVFFSPKFLDSTVNFWVWLSGAIAFFLNVFGFLVTSVTSGVTLQVLGNVKNVGTILFSMAVFGNAVSLESWIGCFIVMGGVAMYQRVSKAPPKPKDDPLIKVPNILVDPNKGLANPSSIGSAPSSHKNPPITYV